MQEYTPLLLRTPLFSGFTAREAEQLLPALAPLVKQYQKGEILLMAGYENRDVCIVLNGEASAAKQTRGGGSFTAGRIAAGEIFGDVLAGSHTKSPVTVTALSRCTVMRLPWPNLLGATVQNAGLHRRLLANLVALIAGKYFALDTRLDLLLINGLRRRIATFLLLQAKQQGTNSFAIALNRQELAGYLGCERSALSRELSRMSKLGLIALNKNRFTLLQPQKLQNIMNEL